MQAALAAASPLLTELLFAGDADDVSSTGGPGAPGLDLGAGSAGAEMGSGERAWGPAADAAAGSSGRGRGGGDGGKGGGGTRGGMPPAAGKSLRPHLSTFHVTIAPGAAICVLPPSPELSTIPHALVTAGGAVRVAPGGLLRNLASLLATAGLPSLPRDTDGRGDRVDRSSPESLGNAPDSSGAPSGPAGSTFGGFWGALEGLGDGARGASSLLEARLAPMAVRLEGGVVACDRADVLLAGGAHVVSVRALTSTHNCAPPSCAIAPHTVIIRTLCFR